VQPVTLEDINDAAKLLDGVIKKTPSIGAGWIEKKYGVDVYIQVRESSALLVPLKFVVPITELLD